MKQVGKIIGEMLVFVLLKHHLTKTFFLLFKFVIHVIASFQDI